MRRGEWAAIAVLGYAHGAVHACILSLPLLLVPWALEFRLGPLDQALTVSVAYVGFGLGSPLLGAVADRRGTATVLMLSLPVLAGGLVMAALSRSRVDLVIALAVLGLAASAYHPTALRYLAQYRRRAGRAFGWHGVGGSLGIAVGPWLAGSALLAGVPWREVVRWLAASVLVAFVLVFALSRTLESESRPRPPPDRRFLRDTSFAVLLGVFVTAGVAYWGVLTFLPQVVVAGPLTGTSLFAIALALGAAGQVVGGYLAERQRPAATLTALSGLSALALLGTWAAGPAGGLVLLPLFGFLLFALEPLQTILVTHVVPEAEQGLAFGLTFLSVFGVGAVGAYLAGLLLGAGVGFGAVFAALAVFLGLSGILAWRIRPAASRSA